MPRVLRNLFPHVWVVGLLLTASVAFGQAAYTAQVRGIVTDQTGAVVQNAIITITNDGTGISTTAHTDDKGLYTVTGLRPASYTVKCEAKGFQSAERKQSGVTGRPTDLNRLLIETAGRVGDHRSHRGHPTA